MNPRGTAEFVDWRRRQSILTLSPTFKIAAADVEKRALSKTIAVLPGAMMKLEDVCYLEYFEFSR